MKNVVAVILTAAVSATAGGYMVYRWKEADHVRELADRAAAWELQKSALRKATAALSKETAPAPSLAAAKETTALTPQALIAQLRSLKSATGSPALLARRALHDLEELIAAGPAALPAIREFLTRDEDLDFTFAATGGKDKSARSLPDEFLVPPSLRFALLEAARRIGGAESEKLLAEVLATTGRGVELAWIARALQQAAPGKYRDVAISGARELLERPLAAGGSPLDRNDREHLFAVLTMFGDRSYVTTAQAQIIQPNGALDRSALSYLQQVMGPQSVPIAEQAWHDARLTDPAKKEPLARLALTYAGTDDRANAFYASAISDLTIPKGQRSNLIEDLNEDGFSDRRNPSASDLPLIENRIALIEQLAPANTDPVNAAAFQEAYKDLVNMRTRLTNPPVPK